MGGLIKNQQKESEKEADSSKDGEAKAWKAAAKSGIPNWVNFRRTGKSAAGDIGDETQIAGDKSQSRRYLTTREKGSQLGIFRDYWRSGRLPNDPEVSTRQ